MMLETDRLVIREMTQDDFGALCKIMCDEEVMRASYESAFTEGEVQSWLNRHIKRYETLGFGLWAVVLKENNEMIGQCGLTIQNWKSKNVLEIGYLFQKAYWRIKDMQRRLQWRAKNMHTLLLMRTQCIP